MTDQQKPRLIIVAGSFAKIYSEVVPWSKSIMDSVSGI